MDWFTIVAFFLGGLVMHVAALLGGGYRNSGLEPTPLVPRAQVIFERDGVWIPFSIVEMTQEVDKGTIVRLQDTYSFEQQNQ